MAKDLDAPVADFRLAAVLVSAASTLQQVGRRRAGGDDAITRRGERLCRFA